MSEIFVPNSEMTESSKLLNSFFSSATTDFVNSSCDPTDLSHLECSLDVDGNEIESINTSDTSFEIG